MRNRFSFRIGCLVGALLVASMVGCASWSDSAATNDLLRSSAAALPKNKKRVVLEVEFVNLALDTSDADDVASLWQWVDETAIEPVTRRRLIANGIRVGMLGNEERFRARLAESTNDPDVVDRFLAEASIASDTSHGGKRIPLRFGRRYEMPLRQPIPGSHVALLRIDDETMGRTLENAQYLLAMTAAESERQEQIRLKIRPEIQYGETRQKWVSSDSAIRIDSRRDNWSLESLEIDLKASERDTLVFSATTPMVGIAKHMLTGDAAGQGQQQLVVLVKVAQIPSAVDQL